MACVCLSGQSRLTIIYHKITILYYIILLPNGYIDLKQHRLTHALLCVNRFKELINDKYGAYKDEGILGKDEYRNTREKPICCFWGKSGHFISNFSKRMELKTRY